MTTPFAGELFLDLRCHAIVDNLLKTRLLSSFSGLKNSIIHAAEVLS